MTTNSDVLVARATTVLSVVFVVGLCATVGVVFWPRIASVGGVSAAPPTPAYAAGEITDTPTAWHDASPVTLILIAQAGCGACQKAQPYFKDLIAKLEGRANVVMASPGPRQDVEVEYGRSLGLSDTAMFPSPPGLRARATPTLLLVNQDGRILGAWEGVGPPERHAALTAAIDALITSATAGIEPARAPG